MRLIKLVRQRPTKENGSKQHSCCLAKPFARTYLHDVDIWRGLMSNGETAKLFRHGGSHRASLGMLVEIENRRLEFVEPSERLRRALCIDVPERDDLDFRLARAVSSTRYVIFGAYLVEHLACRPRPAIGNVLKALPDALGRQIEQLLVGLGVLHHGGGFSVHGQNQRPLGLSQVAQKLCRVVAEGRHGLNVFGDVHRTSFSIGYRIR